MGHPKGQREIHMIQRNIQAVSLSEMQTDSPRQACLFHLPSYFFEHPFLDIRGDYEPFLAYEFGHDRREIAGTTAGIQDGISLSDEPLQGFPGILGQAPDRIDQQPGQPGRADVRLFFIGPFWNFFPAHGLT